MSAGDLLLIAGATALLYLPGAALLWALVGVRPRLLIAGAPVATIAVCYVSGVLTGWLQVGWGPLAVTLTWLVATAAAVLVRTRGRFSRPVLPPRPAAAVVIGAVGVLAACAMGVRTFLRGFGTLSVLPQEHDMVLHTVVVANIARTGRGAPWQAFPVDLLSGEPSSFYPNGFHQFAALIERFSPDPVTALNTALVTLCAVALPVGVATLAWSLRPRSVAPIAAAAAALLAVVAYRPVMALLHDGGILANTAAFAVAPGALAFLVGASRLGWRGAVPVAVAAVGAVAVHPTNAATIGLTAGAWLLVESATREGREALGARVRALVPGGVAAGLLLLPFVLQAGAGKAGSVAAFPRDMPTRSLKDALGITFSAPYGGFFDLDFQRSQTWIAVLAVAGLVACLVARANWGLLAAAAAGAGLQIAYLMNWQLAPVQILSGIYYNSYVRISGVFAIFQWVAGGLAVAAVAWLVARAGRGLAERPRAVLAAATGALLLLGVLFGITRPYAAVDVDALNDRYSEPGFIRVDEHDLAAARYVSERIQPGQRVMNNANDGSTYGYVLYGLPIVLNLTLASGEAPYTIDLLTHFDDLPEDRSVREEVCRLDIAWVIADAEAPPIWAPQSSFHWVEGGYLAVPDGLLELDESPVLELARVFGDVSVYRVDLAALGCESE